MRRGDIYWAELSPRSGSEQSGRRPVIIVSHDGFNSSLKWQSLIVVPLSTSPTQARRGPTVVDLGREPAGLNRESWAVCHQVTTLDRSKLGGRIGNLGVAATERISRALRIAMDLD